MSREGKCKGEKLDSAGLDELLSRKDLTATVEETPPKAAAKTPPPPPTIPTPETPPNPDARRDLDLPLLLHLQGKIRACENRIRAKLTDVTVAAAEQGGYLAQVRDALPHGMWERWCRSPENPTGVESDACNQRIKFAEAVKRKPSLLEMQYTDALIAAGIKKPEKKPKPKPPQLQPETPPPPTDEEIAQDKAIAKALRGVEPAPMPDGQPVVRFEIEAANPWAPVVFMAAALEAVARHPGGVRIEATARRFDGADARRYIEGMLQRGDYLGDVGLWRLPGQPCKGAGRGGDRGIVLRGGRRPRLPLRLRMLATVGD